MFKHPRVTFVSFAVEVGPADTHDVIVIETDLHLNRRHPAYNADAVKRLIAAAQAYIAENADHSTVVRLVSNNSGEI